MNQWIGRMPDGQPTTDKATHAKAWRELARLFCEEFHAKLVAYDPGLRFRFGEDTGSDIEKVLDLPVEFIVVMNEVIKESRKGKVQNGNGLQEGRQVRPQREQAQRPDPRRSG